MKKNNKKGFTLVELLCVIVILGLLITGSVLAITKMIEHSKKKSIEVQEKLVVKACQSYVQDHREKAPKVVGESKNITLRELKEYKYLTEDIYNPNKESCMENSYVLVTRQENKELKFLPYLYCGNDSNETGMIVPEPTVKVLFIDDNNENTNNSIFNNLDASRIYIELTGGSTKNGNLISLDKYNLSISMRTKKDKELKEYYNSGPIYVSTKDTVTIDDKITKYVNAYDATSINITVTAKNVFGGVKETTSIAQIN